MDLPTCNPLPKQPPDSFAHQSSIPSPSAGPASTPADATEIFPNLSTADGSYSQGPSSSLISEATSSLNPIPLPPPRPSQISSARTPYSPYRLDLNALETVVAPVLPFDQSFPTPPLAKATVRNLRLPSFESLGITAPYAVPLTSPEESTYSLSGSLTSGPDDSHFPKVLHPIQEVVGGPSARLSPDKPPSMTPGHSSIHHFILTTNPPDDTDLPRVPSLMQASPAANADQPELALGFCPRTESGQSDGPVPAQTSGLRSRSLSGSPWALDLLSQMLGDLGPTRVQPVSALVRVLTHALPLPSTQGHTFPNIISYIHNHISPRRTTWVSHWHAVSGRFNLADLPTSPPSTPAAPGEGDDYFTTRIFDSAVTVPDYQTSKMPSSSGGGRLLHTPFQALHPSTSPRPAVPPGSIDISVTERYIPPTSSSEFADLFNPSSGRSLVSDRLVELTEDAGILVFIYPTRHGAEVFVRDYLGRVLDPILRRMMILRQLSQDLCESIGKMKAVEQMLSFDELKSKCESLCSEIQSPALSEEVANKFRSSSGRPISYTLAHASTQEITLTPQIWSEWWCKQEKPRIRTIFENFLRQNPGRLRSVSGVGNIPQVSRERMREDSAADGGGAMSYILEILEGVQKGAIERDWENKRGIEVGVFVVKKKSSESESW